MATDAQPTSLNFAFLKEHDPLLLQLCAAAERNYPGDPNTTLLKLRQFGEALAQQVAAAFGIDSGPESSQADLLAILQRQGHIDRDVAGLLHALRREGNDAAHRFTASTAQAKEALKLARSTAIWFHRAFGKSNGGFKPGPFQEPTGTDYRAAASALESQVALRTAEAIAATELAAQERARREAAEQQAAIALNEKGLWEQLAQEEERERLALHAAFDARLEAIRAEAQRAAPAQSQAVVQAVTLATTQIVLDEDETRVLIDAQLRAAGWEADSESLRFSKGARPEGGKNRAIAEWPTASGPADYVLFRGLTPLAVVEAKKFATDVSTVVEQSERYSLGFEPAGAATPPQPPSWTPAQGPFEGWPALHLPPGSRYRVPFVFATNGRSFHRQLLTKSGVWFRDVRRASNSASALPGWHTPEGLQTLLEQDKDAAEHQLAQEPFGYLNLRDYQVKAVRAVEAAIAAGRREALVAMATGTGKTRTVIGLVYRLLKAKRFNRILFLVDRTSLGEQAQNAFKDTRLEQNQLFTDIYDVKEIGDAVPDTATKVHVATVQGMVRRLFANGIDGLPIDRYDCIVIDEAHRGYILDREMGEGELEFCDEGDYISTYRRVLDQFDAVKIALTATPAQHTTEIFGLPVYTYSYTEAVIDGWLVDHEPPIRLRTKLSSEGIHFQAGAQVQLFNTLGDTRSAVLPDELEFDVDAFNRLVITQNFNRVVCAELAKAIDPMAEGKTLIFCANDQHADLVVQLLKTALEAEHGPINDKTVMKITGRSDKPAALIRRYKNESLPKIAVTVDLLTTGIDVPAISNIVFLRRVRSRILYEQMLGRATRLCPEIGKESFRIFDAVDIYDALDPVSTMKPVVQNARIPLKQLIAELQHEKAHQTVIGQHAVSGAAITHADEVRGQILVRMRSMLRRARRLSEERPAVAQALDQLRLLTQVETEHLASHLKSLPMAELRAFLAQHGPVFDELNGLNGAPRGVDQVVSHHEDELLSVEHGYGAYERPEDYLEAFRQFISDNVNKIAALEIVVTRPRELTRADLRELLVELAKHQFTDKSLQAAWKQARNEDIAATIIGYIRQLAIGSPLMPFATRVDRAVAKLLGGRQWTPPQRKWLDRIAKTLKESVAVDPSAFNVGAYANHGGFKALDAAFDGQAQTILRDLEEAVWDDAA